MIQVVGIILLFGCFAIVYSCSQQYEDETAAGSYDRPYDHAFVGDKTCQSCHAGEWEQWKGSQHDYAIGEADDEHVRGDFDETTFSDGENSNRFYREGKHFMVDITGLF